jgi:hypothetical protein
MKSETQKISITVEKKDALAIINTLRKGLGDGEHFEQTTETKGARDMLKLLDANFINSVGGVNIV